MDKDSIIQAIKNSSNAVVMAHLNPDGDTLASMLALAKVLEQFGLEVDRFMHDPVPEIYKFLPDSQKVLSSVEDLDKSRSNYDLGFSLDCGSIARLGSAAKLWQSANITINLDHHLSNPLYGKLNWVDAQATCTGQVVNDLAQALGSIDIDKDLASLYYITLLTDTGGFRHSNTNAKVFEWAQELCLRGAEPSVLFDNLFNRLPFRAIKIIGDALSKLELLELQSLTLGSLKLAYTVTLRSDLDSLEAKDEDTDEIVDHIMRIKDIDLCLYLREGRYPSVVKGSLRSANDKIDCSSIASKLNGGGHSRAAGFNLESQSLDQVKMKVFEILNKI